MKSIKLIGVMVFLLFLIPLGYGDTATDGNTRITLVNCDVLDGGLLNSSQVSQNEISGYFGFTEGSLCIAIQEIEGKTHDINISYNYLDLIIILIMVME